MGQKSKNLNILLNAVILERDRYKEESELRLESINRLNEKVQNLEIAALASAADAMQDKRNQQEQIDRLEAQVEQMEGEELPPITLAILDHDAMQGMVQRIADQASRIRELEAENEIIKDLNRSLFFDLVREKASKSD